MGEGKGVPSVSAARVQRFSGVRGGREGVKGRVGQEASERAGMRRVGCGKSNAAVRKRKGA